MNIAENEDGDEDTAVGDQPAEDQNATSAMSNDDGVGRQVTRGPLGGSS